MNLYRLCISSIRILVACSLVCVSLPPTSNAVVHAQQSTVPVREQITSKLPKNYPTLSAPNQPVGRNLDGLFERVEGKEQLPNQHVTDSAAYQRHFKSRVIGARENDAPGTQQLYIIELFDAPLATYRGGIEGFGATNPAAVGQGRLNVASTESAAYRTFLGARRSEAKGQIDQTLGRSVEMMYEYDVIYNGMAMQLTPTEAAKVATLENVAQVTRSQMLEPHTDYGPAWIGAPSVWDGSGITIGSSAVPGTQGEGVVVGIIDAGIDMDHPSFATLGADGYVHTNSRGQTYGICDPLSFAYDPSYSCTEKLIGAWDFVSFFAGDGRPFMQDEESHGTHVASTAAGNVVDPATLNAPAYIYTAPISGVAPHANIIAYDACTELGCPQASTMAAIEQAVIDGVDVVNYSIGGGSFDPWLDPSSLAFLNAIEAGVFVATSAGNSGPAPQTMGSPANAPWMMAIGSSTHNRRFPNNLVDLTGGDGPLADINGQSLTIGYGPAPIVYAGDYGDALCSAPFEPGIFAGEIVVCDRGINARVAKGTNVLAGGAGGFVLANDAPSGDSVVADAHDLPGLHISFDDGELLKGWLASGSGHTATILGTTATVSDDAGDIMSGFSSRGPDASLPDVIKPDVTAPGDSIFAAFTSDQGLFNIISGTSMSSPHVAGAGALLKALHPEWTASEIRSALMATARSQSVRKEDGVTSADPFDQGAGHINVTSAANAGFVLAETADNFMAADPFVGGDPTTLNLASLGNANCVSSCQWTRTIRSTLDGAVDWTVAADAPGMSITVEPAAFTLDAGGTQVITINANVADATLNEWAFGSVNFAPTGASAVGVSAGSMPVAARASAGDFPAELRIETRRNAGQTTIDGINIIDLSALDARVYTGNETTETLTLEPDPTNGDPFDLEAGGVVVTLLDVPENVKRLVVRTQDSEAPDLDLFVGLDSNEDGLPTPDELLCFSVTFTADEVCDFLPTQGSVASGSYWILVQNWLGSGAPEDSFTLSTLMIDNAESEEILIEAPADSELGVPVELTVIWDVENLSSGENVYGIVELVSSDLQAAIHSPSGDENWNGGGDDNGDGYSTLVTMPLTLVRLENDVTITANTTFNSYPAPGVGDGQTVRPGDLVTFDIQVQPEPTITQDEIVYHIEATLPQGITYVDQSATITPTLVDGNRLVWDLPLGQGRYYEMSTSIEDSLCALNSYINLEDFGILADPTLSGDEFSVDFNEYRNDSMPISYWGNEYLSGLTITDNGLVYFDPTGAFDPTSDPSALSLNLPIPDAALPNNLLAPFWRDWEVVYDEVTNRGMTIDTSGSLLLVEYDDVEPAPAGSTEERFDFQLFMDRTVVDAPGFHEIVFMYNNLNGAATPGTIGIENEDGTDGLAYAHDDAVLFDFLSICFDWVSPSASIQFTGQVDADLAVPAELVTVVDHEVNAPSTKPEQSTVELFAPAVILDVYMDGPFTVTEGEPIVYTFTVYNDGIGTAEDVKVETKLPAATTPVGDLDVADDGTVIVDVGDIPGFGIGTAELAVLPPEALVVSGDVAQAAVSAAQIQGPAAPSIVGGGDADPGEFPWTVAIVNSAIENAVEAQFCGGSIIDPYWIVTAAHCISDSFSGATLEPSMVDVIAGIHTLSNNDGQRIGVSQIVRYPFYSSFYLDSDLALLRLEEPITYNDDVAPINLLKDVGAGLAAPYVAGVVSGWGATNDPFTNPDLSNPDFDYADVLQQTTLPLISNADCASSYDLIYGPGFITAGVLCAGFPEGGKSACFGDSGGPLVISDGNGGWLQAGLVVGGASCGFIEDVPNLYTRLSFYDGWISGPARNTYVTSGYYRAFDAAGNEDEGFIQITTIVVEAVADEVPPVPLPVGQSEVELAKLKVQFDRATSIDARAAHITATDIDLAWLDGHALVSDNAVGSNVTGNMLGYFAISAKRDGSPKSLSGRFDQLVRVNIGLNEGVSPEHRYQLYHYDSMRSSWVNQGALRVEDGSLLTELGKSGAYAIIAVSGVPVESEQPESEQPESEQPTGDSSETQMLYLPLVNVQ